MAYDQARIDDLKMCICRLRGIPPFEGSPMEADMAYARWIIREFTQDEIEYALEALSILGPEGIPLDLRKEVAADTEATQAGGHSERAHAKLSASGSKRWLTCTPSAGLEEDFEDSESEFALEGTAAHEYSEILLTIELGLGDEESLDKTRTQKIEFETNNRFFSNEMADHCKTYVDLVIERYHAALATTPNAQISIEERLDFSAWVPEGFGTGDTLIIANDYIEVIDLKYGKGVKVDAEDNTQMRLYGLGAMDAYDMLYDFKEIRMTIVQPRLDNIVTEVLSIDELRSWGDDYVKPRALLADKGEGEFCAGDHCGFCKARHTCRDRAEYYMELEKFESKKAPLLSVAEIAEILAKASALQKWAEDIQGYALEQAEKHGIKYPGWKLVEGKANRKISDEDAVATVLDLEGYTDEQIYNKKMKGIGDLEKLLGKKQFETFAGPYVIKPPGKATLAPETDKRPEINSSEQAERDFED